MPMIDNTLAAQVPQFNLANVLQQGAQAQAAQDAVRAEQLKAKQNEVGSEMRGVAPFVNSPEFPQRWAEAADRLLQRGAIDPQAHERIRNSPSPLMLKSIISQTEDPALSFRREEADRAQKNADRSYGLQVRTANRLDDPTPTGFEANPDAKTDPTLPRYRPLSGGPQDPNYLTSVAKAKGEVPTTVGQGSAVVVPNTGQVIYENKSSGMNDTAVEVKARQIANGDLSALQNIGRGAQAGQTLEKISNRAAQILVDENGMTPAEAASHMSKKLQEFKAAGIGQSTEARTSASREANLNLILKAADAAIPAALEASEAVDRTGWVPINKLIQKGEVTASSPELKKFGMANLQLAEHWARAMNPTGVMRESDRDKALEFLSTADSKDTYRQAVGQLKLQITRERDAVRGVTGGSTQFPAAADKVAPQVRFRQLTSGTNGLSKDEAYAKMHEEGY